MRARACRPCPPRRLGHRPGPPKHAEHASMHAATFHGNCVGCVSENHARADGFGRAASGCGLQVTPAAPQAPSASAVPQPGTQAGPTQTCRACKHSCDSHCTLKCLHAYRACACRCRLPRSLHRPRPCRSLGGRPGPHKHAEHASITRFRLHFNRVAPAVNAFSHLCMHTVLAPAY